MAKNKGKKFESVVAESFLKVPDVSVDRIHDQTTRYKGSTNIADYIVYKKPFQYYIECKSVHGNTLSIYSIPKEDKKGNLHGFYGNITDAQWNGLLEKSKIPGVFAGILCWWVDKDVTRFIDIGLLSVLRNGYHLKSIRYDYHPFDESSITLPYFDIFDIGGTKKRVFFDYDMNTFFRKYE